MNVSRAACTALLALATPLAFAASVFDGFWMIRKPDNSLDPGSQIEFRIEREHVTMNTPMGASYRAKLDGSDSQMAGDANTTSVSVKMPNKHTLVETDRNAGKAWRVTTIEVEADGRTAKVSWKNLKTHQGGGYTLSKQ